MVPFAYLPSRGGTEDELEPIAGYDRWLDPPVEKEHLIGCPLHEDYESEEDGQITESDCECSEIEKDMEADYGDRLNKEKKEG